jgi:poly(beta-D-mannuronate) lyase
MSDDRLSGTRRAVIGGLGAALLAPAAGARAAGPSRLVGPVAVEARRRLVGRPLGGFACHAVPPSVRDLSVEGAYIDRAFSITDPEKLRRLVEATRPLGAYCWQVANLSSIWLAARPMQPEPATCTLQWLDGWAQAQAMLGVFDTADAQHHRRWTLCGIGLAYLKIRDCPGLDAGAKARVVDWFARLQEQATAYYGKWTRGSYSNHIGWWALSVAVTAVALDDREMFEHAVSLYDALVSDILPDGTLPLEMARKSRALGYHIFALTPLIMLAEIGQANGRDLYAAQNGAIHRLTKRVLFGYEHPEWFAERAGASQEKGDDKGKPFTYVWAEIYNARFPDAAVGQQIVKYRPLFYHWLGGNVTDDFGSASLPFPS